MLNTRKFEMKYFNLNRPENRPEYPCFPATILLDNLWFPPKSDVNDSLGCSELCIFDIWNDNIQSSKQKKNEASTPVFDSDWTSVSVPQTSEFTRIGRQFHALSANRYTAGIKSNAITKTIANSIVTQCSTQ